MDDDVTAAVRAFKRATSTTRDDASRRAIWRSLEARTQPRRWRSPVAVGAVALATAAALVLAFGGLGGDAAERDAAVPNSEQAIDAADREPHGGAAESIVPAELDPSLVPRHEPAAAAPAIAPLVVSTKSAPHVPAAPETIAPAMVAPATVAPDVVAPTMRTPVPTDSLGREAALLRGARKAALAKDHAAARVALAAHAREFPRGELAPERWTLTIELACAAGDAVAATRAAAAFASAYPDAGSAKHPADAPCDSMTNQAASGQSSAGAR